MPLFMSSSLKTKTAMENIVGLALLTTSELVLWIVRLASDPAKFVSQPPVIKPQFQRTMTFIILPFILKKKIVAGAEL